MTAVIQVIYLYIYEAVIEAKGSQFLYMQPYEYMGNKKIIRKLHQISTHAFALQTEFVDI